MFQTSAAQIGALIMALTCLLAAWAGWQERIVAATAFVGWITSAAIQDRSFQHPQYATFVLDVLLTIVWIGLAVRWRRGWLSWMAAFQCLTTATHVAAMIDDRIWARASITAYMVWSYLSLAALAWGGVQGLFEKRRAARANQASTGR